MHLILLLPASPPSLFFESLWHGEALSQPLRYSLGGLQWVSLKQIDKKGLFLAICRK
jgi:hypothetical protein